MLYINDVSKPLILVGSNSALYILLESCEQIGIQVHGIVDSDYYGNTETICDVPVIGTEDFLKDQTNQENYNFFCATNWIPENNPIHIRNKQKRFNLISKIEEHNLNCITIIDPKANVSKYSSIAPGVFIDVNARIEPNVSIGKYSSVMCNTIIGHDTTIGKNCVIQRGCYITANCTLEDNVFVSVASKLLKNGAHYGENTFIHDGIYIRRSTIKNEIVSMQSKNQKRLVYYIEDNGDTDD